MTEKKPQDGAEEVVREGYEAAREPERQPDGDPSPRTETDPAQDGADGTGADSAEQPAPDPAA